MAVPDIYDDGEDSSLNNRKSWMTYLTYTLEIWLLNTMPNVVQYLQEGRSSVGHMIDWCEPPQLEDLDSINRKSIYHFGLWAPCGYGMFTIGRMDHTNVKWVYVHRNFYIQYIFSTFEVNDSNSTCDHSAVHILVPRYTKRVQHSWHKDATYCGYREPWNRSVETSTSALYIKQINAYSSINITVKYVAFDKSLKRLYRPDVSMTQLFLTSHQTLSLTQISAHQQLWVMKVGVGSVQRFQLLWISNVVNHLQIFDGLKMLFPLFALNKRDSVSFNETLNCTTQYFQSHIVLDNDHTTINHTLVNFTYRVVKLDAIHLHHNTETNLKSSGQITHSVFSLKPFRGKFAELSVKFHKFQGWNSGGCNYGGYAIQQNIDDSILNSTILGPFCSTTSPRHAYTSQHSLPSFVMNNGLAYLIIYGYGSMYTIDIDIKVSPSSCVGIIEPLLMWYPDKGMTKMFSQDVITTTFAALSIELTPLALLEPLKLIRFRNISHCFYLQSVAYPVKKHITYDISFNRGDAVINTYLSREQEESSQPGIVTLQFTQNYGIPSLKEITNNSMIHLYDLQHLQILQYTGEAYDHQSISVLVIPFKPTTCTDPTSEHIMRTTLYQTEDYVYATTYKSCLLNMAIHSTYVFVLTSKLPNWYLAKSIWYINFIKIHCKGVATEWDTITTRLTVDRFHLTSHTVDFINDEVFLQSYHTALSFVYRRIQQCDRVIMRYRDVGTNLLASYIAMDKQHRARIRVSIKLFLSQQQTYTFLPNRVFSHCTGTVPLKQFLKTFFYNFIQFY